MSARVLAEAVQGAQIWRQLNPYHLSVYVSATATALFLRSSDGKKLLAKADKVGFALTRRAFEKHCDDAPGHLLEYGWAMIRKLHPDSPGPLWLWGKEKHAPAADSPGAPCSYIMHL